MKSSLFALAIIVLLLSSWPALSQEPLELQYPSVPGAQAPTTTDTPIANYAKYVFVFIISISGIIGLFILIYGGFVYFTSAGDPSKTNEAKAYIKSAILGMIILLLSYLIAKTINPQILNW
jgi:vacuolar-type H+-ATPase subunit I/STV1